MNEQTGVGAEIPSAFLSYSWTSPAYAARVERLARDLSAAGVHVVLDQWDLQHGDDKYAFMERSVNDRSISRVLILLDPRYAERADSREGGVGTETQVISAELYGSTSQSKFIPVVMERREDGSIPQPAYLKSRIYADLSDPASFDEQFEQLVRQIHGRPERTRPPVGPRPTYLDTDSVLTTGQSARTFRRVLLEDKPTQAGYFTAYLDLLAAAYEAERITPAGDIEEMALLAEESVKRWLPYRDEFVETLQFVGQYGERDRLYDALHTFFERLVAFRLRQRGQRWLERVETENLSFISLELYLHAVAVLLRAQRYGAVARLMEMFHVTGDEGRPTGRSYAALDDGFSLLDEYRQKRERTTWRSPVTQLLESRLGTVVRWEDLAGADMLLWVRSVLSPVDGQTYVPLTAAHMERRPPEQLPLWVRVQRDDAAFAQLAPALGVRDRTDASEKVSGLGSNRLLTLSYTTLYPRTIASMLGLRLGG